MSNSARLSLLIVDDFPVVREGLRRIIDAERDMHVVAEAGDGHQAIEMFSEHEPDVVLMDLRMPTMNGVEATSAICDLVKKRCRIVILTGSHGYEAVYKALEAGAKSYLLKTAPPQEIVKAVRTVAAGKRYLPPSIHERLAERMAAESLTPREMEILELIIYGLSNAEIAEHLKLTEGTVKGHVNRLLRKLGVTDRTQAALAAIVRGIFLWTDAETAQKVSARL